jgi:hypothetical protein
MPMRYFCHGAGLDFSEFYHWWCSDTPKKGIPVACESVAPANTCAEQLQPAIFRCVPNADGSLRRLTNADASASSHFDIVAL